MTTQLKHKFSNLIRLFLLTVLCVCAAGAIYFFRLNDLRSSELGRAYEHYLAVLLDAHIRRDASALPGAAVNPCLDAAISSVETRKKFTAIASEEFRNVKTIEIMDYSETEAVIEVRYDYRAFTQDFKTGQRTYGPTGRWYWRTEKVVLIKDGHLWKVKEIYFIDWSG